MIAQIKEALTTLIVSLFSKKFIAFVTIAYALYQAKQWEALVAEFVAYAGIEVVDKKKADAPAATPSAEPIPPEATAAPADEIIVVEEQ